MCVCDNKISSLQAPAGPRPLRDSTARRHPPGGARTNTNKHAVRPQRTNASARRVIHERRKARKGPREPVPPLFRRSTAPFAGAATAPHGPQNGGSWSAACSPRRRPRGESSPAHPAFNQHRVYGERLPPPRAPGALSVLRTTPKQCRRVPFEVAPSTSKRRRRAVSAAISASRARGPQGSKGRRGQ